MNQAKKRVAVKMLKRLSQKSRKLQSYVRSRLSKKYQSNRKSMILLKIIQHERKVHTTQELGLYKK